jgi:hypothetical protein
MIRPTSKLPEVAPSVAKHVTIAVYGKNKIPTLRRKFFGPNFGTNHSEVLSDCNNNTREVIAYNAQLNRSSYLIENSKLYDEKVSEFN